MTKKFSAGQPAVVVAAATWTMFAVASIFLALRLYCRTVRALQLWWDDYILIIGWCFMVSATSLLSVMMHMGYADTVMTGTRLLLLTRCAHTCHMVSLALTKISFAVTLLRLVNRWQRHIVRFVIGSIIVVYTIHIFTLWRQMCGELVEDALPGPCWDPKYPVYMNVITSFYSGMTDFVLAALPWKVVMDLQMKRSERIGVALAMSMGVIAGIAGVMKAVQSLYTLDFYSPDFIYSLVVFWIFSLAEPNATIVAASIPVLRPLFRDIKLRYYGSTHPDSSNARAKSSTVRQLTSMRASNIANLETGSEQSILPKQGITKTMDFHVDRDNGEAYEMHSESAASPFNELHQTQ